MKHPAIVLLVAGALAVTATMPCLAAVGDHKSTPAVTDTALTVSASDIAAENAYWRKLGVPPPKDGIVLAHPWSQPWSGRSLIVPVTWFAQIQQDLRAHFKDKTPMLIDAAALRADLPILHTALEKNYSGWEAAAKHGWHWNDWFDRWDAMLAAYGNRSIPDSTAFAPWTAYEDFQIDSHSGPLTPDLVQDSVSSRSALLKYGPAAACTVLETADGKRHPLNPGDPAQRPHAARHWDGHALQAATYIVYPSTFGSASGVVCGGQTITATPVWNGYNNVDQPDAAIRASIAALSGSHEGSLATYNTPAPGIGYLRLADFSDAGDEALHKLQSTLPASAGHERLLIVDLRGNGGGAAPIDELSRWIPAEQINFRLNQMQKRSCLYPGLWFNLAQALSTGVRPPTSAEFRQNMAPAMQNISAPASMQCPVSFTTTKGAWAYTEHHLVRQWQGHRPRLLVLVDNGCGSDCEYMTWALAQLAGTVIAGSNTYGLVGFTQPGFMVLPHTRIGFKLATSITDDYGDARSVNGYGLDVDVVLPRAADWTRDSILALATLLAGNAPATDIH